jgi:hypothetical protein
MTGQDVANARVDLGAMWGLGRPLYASELGRILRFIQRDPGAPVKAWETGEAAVPGPASLAIDLMLAGAKPPGFRTP